ncbi:MAG: dihydrofolate reductase [Muribaculaceae bacterium]|nr:dihydrofolate reductase [Muribaculaceae bacterium]
MSISDISIIVAITRNGAIGRSGDLLFHISEDLKRFKELTMGHPIIMGRKTFESFPRGPLPGRKNIVITRQSDYDRSGIATASSFEQALQLTDGATPFIIGGGEIYSMALPLANRIYMTEIDARIDDADTFFPAIDPLEWEISEVPTEWAIDPKSGIRYRYVTLSRRKV